MLSSESDKKNGRLWAFPLPVFKLFHSFAFTRPLRTAFSFAAGICTLFSKNISPF